MSDRLLVRLAPELHRAIRTKADAAGVSMNSWMIQVLAAAAGPTFFEEHAHGGAPRTVTESRVDRWRAERELKEARSVYLDKLARERVDPVEAGRRSRNDEEVLAYYHEVYRPSLEAEDAASMY
jgi:HicB-like protein involved in pilus formation